MNSRDCVVVCCLVFFALSSVVFAADNSCESWFLKSGVKAGTKDCEIDCAMIPSDMGSFDCSAQCDEFCKTYVKPDAIAEIARYVETRTLTPSERSLIAKFPVEAVKAYLAKKSALESTRRIFGNSFRNDESDAYRHFMWSGLMREKIERERTFAFLNAHEAGTADPNAESQMDQTNNKKGIEAAEKLMSQGKFNQKSLEQEALNDLKNGELKVLSPSGKVPEWKN